MAPHGSFVSYVDERRFILELKASVTLYRNAIRAERLLYRIGVSVTLRRTNPLHNPPISGVKMVCFGLKTWKM